MPILNHILITAILFGETLQVETSIKYLNYKDACKLILAQDYTDIQEALERLNILSFDQIIFLNKAKLMYKVYNNLAPVYLHELFQMRDINLDNTASNLRSVARKNYLFPQAKCNLYKGSFLYSGVVVWNSLPTNIKVASSLETFVRLCTEWLKM